MFTKILLTYQMTAPLEGFQVAHEWTLWPNYIQSY